MKRTITLAAVLAVAAWPQARAETWVAKRSIVRVRSKAGPFHPTIARIRKNAQVEVVGKSARGRWLKASGLIVTVGEGKAATTKVVPFESKKRGEVVQYNAGWLPKLALRPLKQKKEKVKVARVTEADIGAMRASIVSAIRGLNDKVSQVLHDEKLDKKLAEWIAAPKFMAQDYETFRDSLAPEANGREIEVDGEDNLLEVDPEVQEQAGRLAATEMAQELGHRVVTDPALNRYVNMVAAVIGEFSSRYDLLYRVVIVDDESPNSYSRPGGYIAITTGLLALCQNEAELAGALAHEIAHVSRDHGLKERENVTKEIGIDIHGGMADLDKELHKGDIWADSRDVFKDVEKSLTRQFAIYRDVVFSKPRRGAEEREADEYALVYMARAGYDPDALRSLVDRIGQIEGYDPDATMRLHDPPRLRLITIQAVTGKYGLKPKPGRRFAERYRRQVHARLEAALVNALKPVGKAKAKQEGKSKKKRRDPDDPFAELDRFFGEMGDLE